MHLVTTTLGRLGAALLMAMLQQAPAWACSCAPPAADRGNFLHLNKDAKIALPENALGVLYMVRPELKIRTRDRNGNVVLHEAPPKVKAKDFVIRDLSNGRIVKTKIKRLDIDSQLGETQRAYFLLRKGAMGADEPAVTKDVLLLAEQQGLRDISAAVRDAGGLFRVSPATPFVAGRSYSITAALEDDEDAVDKAEVTIGPRLVLAENERFTLLAQSAPVRELLDVAGSGGSCTAKRAAMVQQLRFSMPPQREPYRHLLATFTQQQFFGADLKRFRAPAKAFIESEYRSSLCADAGFGASEFGPGKDLVYASCQKAGEAVERRQVRGFAGMLELEDMLHETPVLDIGFEQASGPGCWRLRLVEDGGSASALRGWFTD